MFFILLNLQCYSCILLGLTAIVGDLLVEHSNLQIYKAVFDNVTHSVIGGLSWFIISLKHKNHNLTETLFDILLCAMIASFIDLDHFIMAKSWNLKDASNLTHRPFLHCTTIPLLSTLMLLATAYIYQSKWLKKMSLLIATAFLSHHTRDATRRGYWIYPFGSTRPIPYILYVILTVCIPYTILFLTNYVKISIKGTHTFNV